MITVLLVIAGAVLFATAHPGFFLPVGCSFFAWFYYVPVLLIVRRSPYKSVWFWGGLYAVVSYSLFGFWLFQSYQLAVAALLLFYFIFYAILFLLLKYAESLFKERSWIVQWLIINASEYVRTLGFAGFSYGITGYTQWRAPIFIQISRITGVWGVSALVTFASALLYRFILPEGRKSEYHLPVTGLVFFAAAFMGVTCYGIIAERQKTDCSSVSVVAVQSNTDPWKGGIVAYEHDIQTLELYTDRALTAYPETELVVWPETAVVPSIVRQYTERKDRKRFELIQGVLKYIDSKKAVFVVGNDRSVVRNSETEDYNSVLVFTPGKNVIPPEPEVYSKQHLVPFTEYFPWSRQFPHLYHMLLQGDTHLWSPGTECTVFRAAGLLFATPVCFEDTFGDGCRRMVRNGARAFVSLSNDAWSHSSACQNQHMAMAVFRSVENGVPSVRSTASGVTSIVDEHGKIIAMAPAFTGGYAAGTIHELSVQQKMTFYTYAGDWLGNVFLIAAAAALVAGCIAAKARMR